MKSRITYLSAITLLFFSSCTPPGGEAGKSGGTGGTIQLVFLGLMILVFWMFFIRPQAKRAKNQKSFIENLGKGDKIVTSPGSYLKIEKSAISLDWTTALNKPVAEKK